MRSSMSTFRRNTLHVAAWSLLLSVIGIAGEDKAPLPPPAQGNAISRTLHGNFQQPVVTEYDLRGDSSLDALVRDGKLPLSVDDAIRLALENNVDINVERYNPYFTVWGIQGSKAVLNPSLQINSSLNRAVNPTQSALQGAPTTFNINNFYNIDFRKPFEFGMDLDVNYNVTRYRTNNVFSSLNPAFTPNIGVTLTQHLLKDYGRISRGRYLRIARNNYGISEEAFAVRVRDIVTSVLNAYWDVAYSDEDIKVKEASRKLAEIVLDQNKIQAQVGTMAPLDVVQAEAEVAAREEAVVLSRFNKRISEDQLKKLISTRVDPGVIAATVEPTSRPEPPQQSLPDVRTAIQHAIDNRQEIKELLKEQDNNKIQVDYTRNQLRPTLDLLAVYSQNGLGGDTILRDYSNGFFNAPVIGITPGGFWDAMSSLFSQRYQGYTLGLTLKIPFGNDDARANSAQAQINYRQGETRISAQRQQIALEVRQAYENIAMNQALAKTAEVTVRYQQQRLQGEQDKYALGATTTRSIIEAQRDLQDAQTRLLQAKTNLVKSLVALDRALGDTLTVHNIELSSAMKPVK